MALRLTAANTEWVGRSSDLIDYNSAYTIMAWVRLESVPAFSERRLFDLSAGLFSNVDQVRLDAGNTLLLATVIGGSETKTYSGLTLATGEWVHVTMVREDSSNLWLYKNGSSVDAGHDTVSMSGRTSATQLALSTDYGNPVASWDGRIYACKAWTRALSLAEIQREMRQVLPVSHSSLYEAWPLLAGSNRAKGYYKGRDWTEYNTPTDEDPPPVAWSSPRTLMVLPVSGGGSSAILGDGTIALATSASLSGSGALASSQTVSVTGSGTLSGTGLLDADGSVSLAVSSTLEGAAAASVSATVSVTSSGSLAGIIHASGSGSLSATLSGSMLGVAAAQSAATIAFTSSANLGGRAAAAAAATISLSANLISGSIVATGKIALTSAGSLTGSGTLSAPGTIYLSSTSTLSYLLVTEAEIADKVVLQKDFVQVVVSPSAGFAECEVTIGDPDANNIKVYAPSSAPGSVEQGEVEIDFGPTPGTNIASSTVAAAWVDPTKRINAWVEGTSTTTDHNAYEHMIFPGKITVSSISAGVSFTLSAVTDHRVTGKIKASWRAS